MISIRTMTEYDIPSVAELEKMVFSDPWSEKVYRETYKITGVEYVVAVDDEKYGDAQIIGAAGVRNIAGTGEITNVMVMPEYRHKGVGRRMMEELIERGRILGASELTLEVRINNTHARRLYEELGFKCEGIRPRFYRNPEEDAAIYWLRKSDESTNCIHNNT